MLKSWKNIIFIFVIALVFNGFDGFAACSSESGIKPAINSGMKMQDCAPVSFSNHNDVCEDEQMQQVIPVSLFVELVVLIKNPHITDLNFQSILIPWEPPKE